MLILDGKQVAESVKNSLKATVDDFVKSKGRRPGLAVVLIGDNPASAVYVKNKILACEKVGIESFHHSLKKETPITVIKELIYRLNNDQKVDAILVQLPLPPSLDKNEVLSFIDPAKDADGLTLENQKLLYSGKVRVVPCTPAGVMEILNFYKISPKNKKAVVVGRSDIVGKPMSQLLKLSGADVDVVHSKTIDPQSYFLKADIIVVAAGVPGLIGKKDLKKDAIVIDVGIHRTPAGLCGDVRFQELEGHAFAATPVPGGVGPMTIAMLLKNTLTLALQH